MGEILSMVHIYLTITVQADSGGRSEAEALYQEALEIYRQLAQDNPAVYLPDMANLNQIFQR